MGNRPLIANSGMTLLDACLAAGTLDGVYLAVTAAWSWADPLVAATAAVVALREALETWGDSK